MEFEFNLYKLKKYLIIVFTFCQSIILFGQQQNLHYVDSLELVLKIVKDEDKKFHILNELSRFSLKSDYKKSLAYFKMANAMLSHLKDSSYYGDYEMTTALHLQFSGEADSAEMAYLRAIPLLINENRKPALSVCYKELAGLNFDKGLF